MSFFKKKGQPYLLRFSLPTVSTASRLIKLIGCFWRVFLEEDYSSAFYSELSILDGLALIVISKCWWCSIGSNFLGSTFSVDNVSYEFFTGLLNYE